MAEQNKTPNNSKTVPNKTQSQKHGPNILKPERPNAPNTEQRSRTPEHCFVRALGCSFLSGFILIGGEEGQL